MVTIDPESSPSDRTDPASDGATPQPVPTGPLSPPGGMGRLLAFAAVAGIVAGVASMVVGEIILERYRATWSRTSPAVRGPKTCSGGEPPGSTAPS